MELIGNGAATAVQREAVPRFLKLRERPLLVLRWSPALHGVVLPLRREVQICNVDIWSPPICEESVKRQAQINTAA